MMTLKRSSSGVQKNIPLLSDSDFDHSHVPRLLGSGSYGLVQTVSYRRSICAAKYIHSALIEHAGRQERKRVIENFMKECERCKNITHPNIVEFHGVYYPPDSQQGIPVMIMELMDRNLDSYIMKNSPTDIPLMVKCSILFDVATGLSYLHQMDCPMIHRDLTPTNILLKSDPSKGDKLWTAKIADLGVAKVIEADSNLKYSRIPGCCTFMPPEALTEDPHYTTSLDVFSFGGVMLFMATHEWPSPEPISTDDSNSLVSEVERRRRGYLNRVVEGMTKLRPLIEACLNNDPSKRPTMVDVLSKMNDLKKKDYYVDFEFLESWPRIAPKCVLRKSGSSKDDLALIENRLKASSAPASYHHTEDDWYVGCIASNEAEKMLKEAQLDGTYLVREKKECKKTYEICVKYKKPHHIDIFVNPYFSITKEKKFTTINDLISYYEEHSLVHSFPHIGTQLKGPYNVVLGSPPCKKVKSPWSISQSLPPNIVAENPAAVSVKKIYNRATPIPLEEELWYHGEISRANAERLVNNDGDCLVRYSSNQGSHVLSAKWGGVIKHFVITEMFYQELHRKKWGRLSWIADAVLRRKQSHKIPLEEELWYHGEISRANAERLVNNDGDCLVRYSSNQGSHVLSAKWGGVIKHFIITEMFYQEEYAYGFQGANGFPSITALLSHYIESQVSIHKYQQFYLKQPVYKQITANEQHPIKYDSIIFDDRPIEVERSGHIYFGTVKHSYERVTIKKCHSHQFYDEQQFLQEANILRQLKHSNIVTLLSVCNDEKPVYIVLEMMRGHFLQFLHELGKSLTTYELTSFMLDAAMGMQYLTLQNYIHRNLSARSCMVKLNGDVLKIFDFSMCTKVEKGLFIMENDEANYISVKWAAPEVFSPGIYTSACDVWSYGVLMYEAYSYGQTPYYGMDDQDVLKKVHVQQGYRMKPPEGTPKGVHKEIMLACWNFFPKQRPTFQDIVTKLSSILAKLPKK